MGRTLPSATQLFLHEEASLSRFRRALRQGDQQALDELLDMAQKHLSAVAYAGDLLPFEMLLLAMLLEEHKQCQQLRRELGWPDGDGQ